MSHEPVTRLTCDDRRSADCLRSFEGVGGLSLVRRYARMVGWVHRRDELFPDVCPACELSR